MNKKNNRKGFTTVELVIVIAVIAILATVLIPTFSGLIGKANDSAALQVARNAQTAIMNQDLMPNDSFTLAKGETVYIQYKTDYWFTLKDGQLAEFTMTDAVKATLETETATITDLPTGITVWRVKAA